MQRIVGIFFILIFFTEVSAINEEEKNKGISNNYFMYVLSLPITVPNRYLDVENNHFHSKNFSIKYSNFFKKDFEVGMDFYYNRLFLEAIYFLEDSNSNFFIIPSLNFVHSDIFMFSTGLGYSKKDSPIFTYKIEYRYKKINLLALYYLNLSFKKRDSIINVYGERNVLNLEMGGNLNEYLEIYLITKLVSNRGKNSKDIGVGFKIRFW